MTKSIVEHNFTYKTPMNSVGYRDGFNYRKHVNFWCCNHPLNSIYKKVFEFVPAMGESDIPQVEMLRLVCNMHYDAYNNGGGNSGRWSISQKFKKAIRQSKLDKEVILSLEQRLSDVFKEVGRGRNFGWIPDYNTSNAFHAIELLLTDVVYYAGMHFFPEDVILLDETIKNKYEECYQ
jgi:hypothetical protein